MQLVNIKNKQLELPTGIFYRNGKAITATGNKAGYIIVEARSGTAHRLIAQFLFGQLRSNQFVDHIDGNGTNNALSNLRLVNHKENQWNKTIKKTGDFNLSKKGENKYVVVFHSIPEPVTGMTKCKTHTLYFSKVLSYEAALELRQTVIESIKKHLNNILTFEQIYNELF